MTMNKQQRIFAVALALIILVAVFCNSDLLWAIAIIAVIAVLIYMSRKPSADMDLLQAEKIVNAYGGAIAKDTNVFKKQSTLPCSKAKIRDAFYSYLPSIIDQLGELPKDLGESLVLTYCMMDAFVPDKDADRLNKINERMKNKQLNSKKPDDQRQIEEYLSFTTVPL